MSTVTTILIILHVLSAVLFIGPTTYAVSTFQGQALKAREGDTKAAGTAKTLYQVTTRYGVLAALVPLFGVAIMFTDTDLYWSQGNYHAAIGAAVIAWVILLLAIIPAQRRMMGALGLLEEDEYDPEEDTVTDWDRAKSRLSMFGGLFALLWVIMLVLMYVSW